MPDFHVTFMDLLHAVNLRHGTKGFNSAPKEGVLRIFFFALKNPTASAGFEPRELGCQMPARYLQTTEAAIPSFYSMQDVPLFFDVFVILHFFAGSVQIILPTLLQHHF